MPAPGDDHGLSSPTSKKKNRTLWRRLSYAGIGLSIGSLFALHYVPGSLLLRNLAASAEQRDCTLIEPGTCDLSMLTGNGHIDHIKFILNDTKQTLFAAKAIDCSFSPMSSFFGDKTEIDFITIEELSINLRSQNPEHEYWSDAFKDLKQRLGSSKPKQQSSKTAIQRCNINHLSILWPLHSSFDIHKMQASAELKSDNSVQIKAIGHCKEHHEINFECLIAKEKTTGSLSLSQCNIEEFKNTTLTPKMGSLFRLLQPVGNYRVSMNFESTPGKTEIWIQAYSSDSRLKPKPLNTIWMNAVQNLGHRMDTMRNLEIEKGLDPIELRWDYKITIPEAGPIGENYGISLLFEQVNKRISEIR